MFTQLSFNRFGGDLVILNKRKLNSHLVCLITSNSILFMLFVLDGLNGPTVYALSFF
jgi:hypothetical protein